MIRAVLVDDEPPARVRMRQLLEALVAASPARPAGERCARILDEVRRHRSGRQGQDDVTALVVRAR